MLFQLSWQRPTDRLHLPINQQQIASAHTHAKRTATWWDDKTTRHEPYFVMHENGTAWLKQITVHKRHDGGVVIWSVGRRHNGVVVVNDLFQRTHLRIYIHTHAHTHTHIVSITFLLLLLHSPPIALTTIGEPRISSTCSRSSYNPIINSNFLKNN